MSSIYFRPKQKMIGGMTEDCPICGRDTEGFDPGIAVAFRGVPRGDGGPPIKPAPMPYEFECGGCGHKWKQPAQPR